MSEQQQPAASPATSEDREAWLKTGSKLPATEEPDAAKIRDESDDKDEANPFSQYYGMLLHQQNMLQDHVRTGTYERAMLSNPTDFRDKVVLDVGTGSGILAFFAIKAGARKVYAVELSNMAECARELVAANGLSDRITVIKGKMEEVQLPEQVDVVVSEPMGFFLVHERMLETFVTAGKKWRRPAPSFKMFPSIGTMFMSPFSDDSIYREQMAKVAFWQQQDFYGVNLSRPTGHFDFPFHFVVERTAIMHGLGCWFTVDFLGSDARVVLSTAPHDAGTHWYQCRLLLSTPVAVNASQSVSGNLHFVANKKFSYDIDLEVRLDGTSIVSRNHIRLHDQMYHYLYSPGAASGAATDGMQQQNSSY
ncbi:S-adenosyl-L-methionine-dependent methyltransferase [Phytophthora cactorum]|nr:S-adenosyl-L-methionine-dependent methyltransferase [Phytophthora cactorum]